MIYKNENSKKDWTETKYFWICNIVEFVLIGWIRFYYGISHFPNQYTCIKDFANAFLLFLVFYMLVFAYPIFMICCSRKGTIITIVLTIIVWIMIIVNPIIKDYNDPKWKCYDRTTYDNNRNNDIKCVNKYWEVEWMEYEDIKNIAPNAVIWWGDSDTKIRDDKYTKEIYNLINEHMYNSKWECVKPYNIFDKERDAYYWYELLHKIVQLEQAGVEFETDIEDWPHSLDFRFWVRYNASAKLWYMWCLNWCWLMSDTKEYKNCVF